MLIETPISSEVKEYFQTVVLLLDLLGTFVFALSGGVAAVRNKLDVFGVLVISFVAGNTGGIIRDILIGAVPPAAITDWRYLAVSVLAGVAAFFWYQTIHKLRDRVQILDAVGLGLFAVAGTQKALAFGLNPISAALLGMTTGIGGGILRDVLLARVPAVLSSELYAVAALAGATVVVMGNLLRVDPLVTAGCGAVLCFGLRFLAIQRRWHLPTATDKTIVAGDQKWEEQQKSRLEL